MRTDSMAEEQQKLEQARRAMEQQEKQAQQRRAYPAPALPAPPPGRPAAIPTPRYGSNEPQGSGPALPHNQTDVVNKKLFNAGLAFSIKDRANINEDVKAQLLINPSKDLADLEKDLTVSGTKVSKKVKVSRVVKATLTAPDFDVVNITDPEQIVSDIDSTEWLWTLKAKSSGTHEVNLSVTAVITVDGRESKHHLKTSDRTVVIEITGQQILIDWLKENWKWIIGTLIIPPIVFVFKEKFKKLFVR